VSFSDNLFNEGQFRFRTHLGRQTRFARATHFTPIKELPNLSEAKRRAIREGLEIANQDPDVASCNQAALDGALMFDRMEDEDARRRCSRKTSTT
jgi:hypothetical protein